MNKDQRSSKTGPIHWPSFSMWFHSHSQPYSDIKTIDIENIHIEFSQLMRKPSIQVNLVYCMTNLVGRIQFVEQGYYLDSDYQSYCTEISIYSISSNRPATKIDYRYKFSQNANGIAELSMNRNCFLWVLFQTLES